MPRLAGTATSGPRLWGGGTCARLGKTCCQDGDILLTKGGIHRISRHAGKACERERRRPAGLVYLDRTDDRNRLKRASRPDGTRPVLKPQASGDCSYLTPMGGSLPMEIRPPVRRLNPYERTGKGGAGVSAELPDERCATGQDDPRGTGDAIRRCGSPAPNPVHGVATWQTLR